jgi:pimeloyl-ACP methyl ester carboxylesterase
MMYDLRGHGRSEAPETGYGVGSMADDLAALLAARGWDRVHLIAHSFGGMIALAHALRHPESVASLTLVDVRVRPIQKKISIPVRQLPPVVERQLAEMGVDLGAIPEHDDGVGYLRTVARIEVEAGDMAADLLAQIYRHPRLFRSRKNAERWIDLTERVSLIADLDREETFTVADLRRLAMPMLILVGGLSSTLPSAREMARICPHAVLREVPDVGHFFPMSQPRLFLRPTLRFLRAVEMGRGVQRAR